jgi:hypothetical protein
MTPISLDELRQRIIAIRAGTLPANAVTDDEIRAGIEQLRADRKMKATASAERKATTSTPVIEAATAKPGSLLDRLSKAAV